MNLFNIFTRHVVNTSQKEETTHPYTVWHQGQMLELDAQEYQLLIAGLERKANAVNIRKRNLKRFKHKYPKLK